MEATHERVLRRIADQTRRWPSYRLGLRRTGSNEAIVREMLEFCARVCDECAAECEKHASMADHCRVCAEACRRCAAACRELNEKSW